MASLSQTGSKQTKFPAPAIPETPSRTINEMLKTRFGEAHTNAWKAPIAPIVCGLFTAINMVYKQIHSYTGKQQHSHSMWMVSCGVVSTVVVVAAILIYNILISSAWVIHSLLYYVAWLLSLFAIGIGVSGAVFFDKQGNTPMKPEPGTFKDTFYKDGSKVQ